MRGGAFTPQEPDYPNPKDCRCWGDKMCEACVEAYRQDEEARRAEEAWWENYEEPV